MKYTFKTLIVSLIVFLLFVMGLPNSFCRGTVRRELKLPNDLTEFDRWTSPPEGIVTLDDGSVVCYFTSAMQKNRAAMEKERPISTLIKSLALTENGFAFTNHEAFLKVGTLATCDGKKILFSGDQALAKLLVPLKTSDIAVSAATLHSGNLLVVDKYKKANDLFRILLYSPLSGTFTVLYSERNDWTSAFITKISETKFLLIGISDASSDKCSTMKIFDLHRSRCEATVKLPLMADSALTLRSGKLIIFGRGSRAVLSSETECRVDSNVVIDPISLRISQGPHLNRRWHRLVAGQRKNGELVLLGQPVNEVIEQPIKEKVLSEPPPGLAAELISDVSF